MILSITEVFLKKKISDCITIIRRTHIELKLLLFLYSIFPIRVVFEKKIVNRYKKRYKVYIFHLKVFRLLKTVLIKRSNIS
jgi:hypothetical protein